MTPEERTELMVVAYGEVCTQAVAARVLGRSVNTIRKMLHDGRLDSTCAGTMVDVRSIARYICAPELEDDKARRRTKMRKHKSDYAV